MAAGEADGGEQVGFALERRFDQVGDAFGVGVGGEDVALGGEFAAQGFVVLDDAVVDDGDAAGDVRVGVALGGDAVGGPAGVSDAGDGSGIGGCGFEFGDAADGADAFDVVAADDCQAGRVIAPVFEFLEPFDQDRDDVAAGRSRDDAAHKSPLLEKG